MRYLFCFLIFWSGLSVHAQIAKDTTIDGRPYVIHTVQSQETLYGISREYNAELNQIVVQNPAVIQGLKVGMCILVPLQKLRNKKENKGSRILNVFKRKKEQLQPLKPNLVVSDKTVLKAALLLPFYLDMNDTLEAHNETNNPASIYPQSQTAIEYYTGILMALDTLSSLGINIDLKVLDVSNDSLYYGILDSTVLDDRELIIGPLLANKFKKLANRYGLDTNRRLVSPLSYKNVIKNHANTYQFVPFSELQIDTIVYHLQSKNFDGDVVILGQESEQSLARRYKASLSIKTDLKYKSYIVPTGGNPSRELLKEKLNESENVVLVASNNRAFVGRVIPMMASMEDTTFIVYGLNSWNKFSSLDEIEVNLLNLHMPSVFFREGSPLFYDFMNKYVKRFKEYPNKYAYTAYKQLLYMCSESFESLYYFEIVPRQKGKLNLSFPLIHHQDYKQQVVDY